MITTSEAIAEALASRCRPSSRWRAISVAMPRTSSQARAETWSGTSSSSAKSSSASTIARAVISRPRQASNARLCAPDAWRSACRRCASVSASIRSASPSTSVRSSLPLRKARRVNSPGSAGRSPGIAAERRQHSRDDGPAAVNLKLGDILARETALARGSTTRARSERARSGPQGRQRRPAWFRNRSAIVSRTFRIALDRA